MSKKRDIRVVTLENYVKPDRYENISNNWVLNGRNHQFYQYIIDRRWGSPTNSSILSSYSTMTYGKGLGIHEDEGGTEQDLKQFLKYMSKNDQKAAISDYVDFGEVSLQIHRQNGNKKKLAKIEHVAKNKVASSVEDENGDIISYWFSNDWANKGKQKNRPVNYPAFGYGDGSEPEIYVSRPYQAGKEYYANPEYFSALPYADLEEEIANFYISHAKNGMSFGTVINVPNSYHWEDHVKDDYEIKIKEKITGSSQAGEVIVSFNDANSEAITVDNTENNTAHKQWDFLVKEAKSQLLTAHKAISPVLVGVSSSSGFSSTADEIEVSFNELTKLVIQPKRDFIIDAFEEILSFFNIEINGLYFRPLTEIEGEEEEKEKIDETVEMSKCDCSKKKVELEDENYLLKYCQDEPKGYDLDSVEYNLERDNVELSSIQNSEQDDGKWKIRYAYNIGTSKNAEGGSRDFCNKMMSLSRRGKVFRSEDIEQMQKDGVNIEFGHNKKAYSIWLYAGGVNCYHRWERRIYKKKTQKNGNLYGGNATQNTTVVNVNEARRQGADIVKNPKDVSVAEILKPNKGRYPS